VSKYESNKIKKLRLVEQVAPTGEERGAYDCSVEVPEGNRPLVRPKPQWGDNVQVYLKNLLRGCWLDISGYGYGYGGLF
jgi:hypothetical protein